MNIFILHLSKFFIIAFAAIIIGLPIISVFDLALFFTALIIVIYGEIRVSSKLLIALFLVLSLIILKIGLPNINIQEGHNIFIYSDKGETFERELPPFVFDSMKKDLISEYPPQNDCGEKNICWKYYKNLYPLPPLQVNRPEEKELYWKYYKNPSYTSPDTLFALSGDGILQKSKKYSRIVHSIDFDNLESFRSGFINESRYNFYQPNDMKRQNLPFFVMYLLPEQALGGSLCWRGNTLWETEDKFLHKYHNTKKCIELTSREINKKVFGWSIKNNQPLSISFTPPFKFKIYRLLADLLKIVGIASLLLFSLKIDINRELLGKILITLSVFLIITLWKNPSFITGFPIHQGGGDGLVHEGFGRIILKHAFAGNWFQALKGNADIFYYMPGFRYFRAIEKVIFGDTNFGYILITLLFPLLIYKFIGIYFPKRTKKILFLVFLFITPAHILGFSYYEYIRLAHNGFGEILAFAFLLTSLLLSISKIRNKDRSIWTSFLVGLFFATSIFIRPNLILFAGAFSLLLSYNLIADKRIKEVTAICIGLSFTIVMLIHNYIYGDAFVLLTRSATIPANLVNPPSNYIEILKGNFLFLPTVLNHIAVWLGGKKFPMNTFVFIIWAITAAIHCYIFIFFLKAVIAKKSIKKEVRIIAISTLLQHLSFLFYQPNKRYAMFVWLMTTIISFIVIYDTKFRQNIRVNRLLTWLFKPSS